MRDTAKFANRVLSVTSVSKMPAGLWSKLCREVIEPVLEDLSKSSRTVEIDGERCDAYLDHMPIGEADDEFAKKVTPDIALELYLTQREYSHVTNLYDRALTEPPVEMPEDIAKRLSEGISQVEELNRFLVVADAFVEIADDFAQKEVNKDYVIGLLRVSLDVYAHYLLLAPLDIDSEISVCGGMISHCVDQRDKVKQICEAINGDPESTPEPEEAEEESDTAEEAAEEPEEPTASEESAESVEEPVPAEEAAEDAVEAPEESVAEEAAEEESEEEPTTSPDAADWAGQVEESPSGEDEFQFVNGPAETAVAPVSESEPSGDSSENTVTE